MPLYIIVGCLCVNTIAYLPYTQVLASGRAWIARGHRHGDAFGRRLLPQNLPKPSVVCAFMRFAVAEAQTQDGVGVVVYDIDDCEEEAGSNVCIRCNDQMNLSAFGDSP